MKTCGSLTIFEGPDGSGKTTAAKAFAAQTGARYVHLPQFKRVTTGLPRMYLEAMLPALLGYQDVVMDRCWLSEVPYGRVFRGGADRVGEISRHMLERVALRAGALVVLCLPPLETIHTNLAKAGKVHEYDRASKERVGQLYDEYRGLNTDLSMHTHDYTETMWFGQSNLPIVLETMSVKRKVHPHPTSHQTVGRWNAPVVLVGETFGEHKNEDGFNQWPFVSFSRDGCSSWLTEQLSELDLLWVNADQDLSFLHRAGKHVIALGGVAAAKLTAANVNFHSMHHPQHWKRFHAGDVYPLKSLIIDLLRGNVS